MLTNILIILAILLVILVIFIATRPGSFRVSRSASIAAQPVAVFEWVNDFRRWEAWSPWAKLDPKCKRTFEGAPSGARAVFKWSGNNRIGEGRHEIIESRPGEMVRIKLEFIRPFRVTNRAGFTFESEGNDTLVTWTMSGKNSFLGKAFSLVMNCDKMLGPQFEKGLASLKSIVEAAPRS